MPFQFTWCIVWFRIKRSWYQFLYITIFVLLLGFFFSSWSEYFYATKEKEPEVKAKKQAKVVAKKQTEPESTYMHRERRGHTLTLGK